MRRGVVRPERVAFFVAQFDGKISGIERLRITVYGAVAGIQAHVRFDEVRVEGQRGLVQISSGEHPV